MRADSTRMHLFMNLTWARTVQIMCGLCTAGRLYAQRWTATARVGISACIRHGILTEVDASIGAGRHVGAKRVSSPHRHGRSAQERAPPLSWAL